MKTLPSIPVVALLMTAAGACGSTQLEVARNDAAHPSAAGAPIAPAARALRTDFDPAVAAAPTAASSWTCPMHPEIKRPAPGKCPICGMDLKPVATPDSLAVPPSHEHHHEH